MALNMYNPFTKVAKQMTELDNLRLANEHMKAERDKYREQVTQLEGRIERYDQAIQQQLELLTASELGL